jgi:hypothetical protein
MPGFVPFQLRTAKKVRARIKVRRIEKGYLEKSESAVVRKMGVMQDSMKKADLDVKMLCYKGYVMYRNQDIHKCLQRL